ncbi:SDR family oxidoreductase [bacterium]|nr:SDR family oxidoreductase [bacterium]
MQKLNILVIGCFGLLGSNLCRTLDKNQFNILPSSRSSTSDKKIFPLLSQCKSSRFYLLDAASESSIYSFLDTITNDNITLHGIVNCSSFRPEPSKDMSITEIWSNSVLANSLATFLPCQIFGDYLASLGGGSIVNVSSIYGIGSPLPSLYESLPITTEPMYPFVKGGIISLTKYFASFYASRHVRFNVVSPGGISNNQPQEFVDRYSSRVPLNRMCLPHEITGAVEYLLSSSSSYTTGTNIAVDGGWSST